MFLCCMKTVNQVNTRFKQGLIDIYDAQEIQSLIMLILSGLLRTSKAKLKAFPELAINEQQAEKLEYILNELKTGRPLQYIMGHTEFYGLPFKVNPSVLIPRPETEELVEWIIRTIKSTDTSVKHLLDIGTGSGCIAITLKKHLPDVQVSAIDISTEALQIARQNALLNKVEINFIQADILNIDQMNSLPQFDMIVSNPPYVTPADKQQMHSNVTDFEPHAALFVPEDNPLLFYNAISNFAVENLKENGWLFFEINENLGKQTVELMKDKSFKNIILKNDLFDKNRMIKAGK